DALALDDRRRVRGALPRRRGRRHDRQLHAEDRAVPRLAHERELAPMPFDDPVAEREAEPGPLPDRLRREERLEDPVADLGRDTRARVLDVEPDAAPR